MDILPQSRRGRREVGIVLTDAEQRDAAEVKIMSNLIEHFLVMA
jgi:hypothetical protein